MNDMDAWEARERTYTLWLELGAPVSADAKEPDRGRSPMPVDADARRSGRDGDIAGDEDRYSTRPAPDGA